MTAKLTNADIDLKLQDRTVKLIGKYINARTKILFGCIECGHEWTAKPAIIFNGKGCPPCGGNVPLNNQIVDARLEDRTIRRIGDYIRSMVKITFGCTDCGHEWRVTPNQIFKGKGCPVCNDISLTTKIVDERLEDRPIKRIGEYINNSTKIIFGCTKCDYKWSAIPSSVFNGTGCPSCANRPMLTNDLVDARLEGLAINRIGDFVNAQTSITFGCTDCGSEWATTPNHIFNGTGCPICADSGFNSKSRARFYIIQVDELFKIGITNRTIKERYAPEGVDYKIIMDLEFNLGSEAAEFEKMVMKENAEHQYKGPQIFRHTGITEMYTSIQAAT